MGGIRIALELSNRQDRFLQSTYELVANGSTNLSIAALGGYGRKELCFNSDIDILFLTENEGHEEQTENTIQKFLHSLMDSGLNIGHCTRNISDCINLDPEDIESRMSLFESRFICGNTQLFNKLVSAISEKIRNTDKKTFIQQISDKTYLRHDKYGNTSKLLEPNIKNSAGGLRDIHTVLWIMRGTGLLGRLDNLDKNETAVLRLLKSASIKKQFTPSFLRETRAAFDFLLRIRNEMHIQSDMLHDTLEFGIQPSIASGLFYRSHDKRKKVELFMQDYYKTSRCASVLCSHVISSARSKWLNAAGEIRIQKPHGPFVLRNKQIDLIKRSIPISNELLLQALLLKNERNLDFSFKFEESIQHHRHLIKPLKSRNETDLFRLLLHRPNAVGSSIRKMNELGLLAKWIPEWKPMVSFFQHNQYHFYTADEHTVIMLTNAELLDQSISSFGSVFRSLPRRDTLYLSCLLHDIGKPSHIGKHEIKGVSIARQILRRLNYIDVAEDVQFLVRHHLLMEQVAFRRDLNDTHTIIDFAKVFDRVELLDYLYVLTYADLSAVNRGVLTEWKELLLRDLYTKTRAFLVKEMTGKQISTLTAQQTEQKKDDILRALVNIFPSEAVESHMELLSDPSYLSAFKPEEIAAHVNTNHLSEKVSALFHHYGRYSEITFISKDSRGMLSKLCGVLTANDANIHDAYVFTRGDGLIIDKFRVSDFISHNEISENVCDKISNDIQEVIAGRIDIARLIERHCRRWKRKEKPLNLNTRCKVVFKKHPRYTLLDIYAPDTLGFLFRITDAISHLKLNIAFAKIATRVDGIVDSFYVLNSSGKKITTPEKKAIKKIIISAISSATASELVAAHK
ncbi:MAG: [protein-PII] uridylyltransferase [Bacteroidetes bacterium]|nr:[protein-PII] uridylyltransferase [Bacteroidota bacterium]